MIDLPLLETPAAAAPPAQIALVGNPNAGKTTLFNALTGLRARTANFPGITVDLRQGPIRVGDASADLLDLPGLYSLDGLSPEEKVTESLLRGELPGRQPPDVIVLVLDATNLQRNLFLASQILDLKRPTVIALNLIDAARSAGITIDVERLSTRLNCPVVPVSARTGDGLDLLRSTVADLCARRTSLHADTHTSCTAGCTGCAFAARHDWAEQIQSESVRTPASHNARIASLDRWLTNPLIGVLAFLGVMLGVFYLIFSLADVPMTLIDEGASLVASEVDELIPASTGSFWTAGVFAGTMLLFAAAFRLSRLSWNWWSLPIALGAAAFIAQMPVEDFRSLIVDGVVSGVGGVVIFLPQICILFFFISLLEDSGYMARAAFVMERLMRAVGLPGKAFVPMLSAHACAIPGIMAARVIENWRDRLVTIIVLPLLTCSARLPVYAMVAALLFSDSPGKAALVFVGAYVLGIAAALLSAWGLKKTILRGDAEPLVLELPPYRQPSLRNAFYTVIDRARVFLRNAGGIILLISIVLWGMATYPKLDESQLDPAAAAEVSDLRSRAATVDADAAQSLHDEADQVIAREALENSYAGRLGRLFEPVFRPLGFDWKMNVGVISSFAAREVIVSTLAIMYGMDDADAEDEQTLVETLRRQRRPDGTPVYDMATSLSLLVFYVLAMQCLPTQVVTRRETGSWKWALFQLGYMTLLAYVAALIVYQTLTTFGTA